jgi:hypothetical protein
MKKEKRNSFLFIIIILSLFPLSYLYRKYRNNDIEANSKFAIGKIINFTTSLKSGDAWHYEFKFNDQVYENYKPTHVDYDVKMGDYFLVNFSSKTPEHSKILYDYKLNSDKLNCIDSIWDTVPVWVLHSGLKHETK